MQLNFTKRVYFEGPFLPNFQEFEKMLLLDNDIAKLCTKKDQRFSAFVKKKILEYTQEQKRRLKANAQASSTTSEKEGNSSN